MNQQGLSLLDRGGRDCRASMTLQEERAGVAVRVPAEKLRGAVD